MVYQLTWKNEQGGIVARTKTLQSHQDVLEEYRDTYGSFKGLYPSVVINNNGAFREIKYMTFLTGLQKRGPV